MIVISTTALAAPDREASPDHPLGTEAVTLRRPSMSAALPAISASTNTPTSA
nr:hypothetical protein [Pseudonocardia sp. AL041005-10]